MGALDPILIEAFPVPPTHIPPPSCPPSTPLPPLPSLADPIDVYERQTLFIDDRPRTPPSPDIPDIISSHGNNDNDDEDEDDDDSRSWIDHDEFGRPIPDSPYESDSSIDLHTPLPNLMLKHGLLSPRSRLLQTFSSDPTTPSSARESVASLTSSVSSKTQYPLKDKRDTEKRRARHKDGKLLSGGIGLTTGLGWSDSEDEDAPSALTRRISSLNMSRRPSLASSTRSLSRLSKSTSTTSSRLLGLPPPRPARSSPDMLKDTTLTEQDHRLFLEAEEPVDEWGQLKPLEKRPSTRSTRWSSHSLPSPSTTATHPPTAWTRPILATVSRPASARTSAASVSSSIPEETATQADTSLPPSSSSSFSSASSISSRGPITPSSSPNTVAATRTEPAPKLQREKSLPPLPPSLRRISGSSNLSGGYRDTNSEPNRHRIIPPSSPGPVKATITPVTFSYTTPVTTPRPLRLATSSGTLTNAHDPPSTLVIHSTPNSTPSSPMTSMNPSRLLPRLQTPSIPSLRSLRPPRSPINTNNDTILIGPPLTLPPTSMLPPTPTTSSQLKPRTGTGMAYRSSSAASKTMPLQSRIRTPSRVGVRPPASIGSVAVKSTTTATMPTRTGAEGEVGIAI